MIYKMKISHKKISSSIVGNIIFLLPLLICSIIQQYPLKDYIFLFLAIFISELIGFLISFCISKKNTLKSTYNFEYYRDYGFDSPPAIVARFIQKDSTDENDLLATLLDLSIRDYIHIDNSTSSYIEKTLKDSTDLKMSLNPNKNFEDLLPYEKYLIDWLFSSSDTTSFNYVSIKESLNNDTDSGSHFKTWKSLVENEFLVRQYTNEENKFYQNLQEYLAIPITFIFIFPWILLCFKLPFITYVVLAIISVICLQVSFNVSSSVLLTQKGVDELQKIKGYVKFIKEYSLIKDTSRQSIIIWNQYLTYCIALNLTEKINKDLKKILGEELYIDKVIYD